MTELFNVTLEDNNLDEFDATANPTDLDTTVAAAMANTAYGLAVTLDGDQNPTYGAKTGLGDLTRFRNRVYFDPNALSMSHIVEHEIWQLFDGATRTATLYLRYRNDPARYQLVTGIRTDGGGTSWGSYFTLADAADYIEIDWKASGGADDGFLRIYVGGVQQSEITGVDNDTHQADQARIGGCGGLDAGTTGVMYFDQWLANDDGNEIGPYAPTLAGFASIF